MRAGRSGRVLWGIVVCAAAVWACETTRNPGGIQRDLTPPNIKLTTARDTQDIAGGLVFTVTASDNLSLKTIRLTYSGGYIAGPVDTTFITQTKSLTYQKTITFPANSGAGGNVVIVGRAIDGAGNFAEDTLRIFLANVQALKVFLIAPTPGAVASTGRNIQVQVVAVQRSGIRKIGFLTSPAGAVTNPTTPPFDSVSFTPPLADSVVFTDTLTVLATSGTFVVQGFAEDSGGRRGTSGTVTVSVLSAANDVTPPSVTDSIGLRVEVSDSVLVHATDPSAISWIGFRVDTGGLLVRFDTINVVAGNLTDVRRMFSLNLAALPKLPQTIVVRGYACDNAAARNCAYSTVNGLVLGTPKADTATVVAGVTKSLPLGGQIGDAIFNKNVGSGELYLTNVSLSRLEIFQVANTSFVAAGIPTAGPQPVGIALWPVDTAGNYDDTVVVANSGGTELSVIDVRPAVRRLAWRQDLPNYLIEKYKVTIGPGGATKQITVYDVSDRPQYLGTVCRPNSGGGNLCNQTDSVFAVYSTTPTQSSTSPFNGKATLRMEKLTPSVNPANLFGHLFWEIGNVNASSSSDTLRIELRRGRPYNVTQVVLSACLGVTVDFNTFGLGDSTFVRNSGNFAHAFVGEGGRITTQFARVMNYSASGTLLHGPGTFTTCNTPPSQTVISDAGNNEVDLGMSPAIDVSDFISNTGIHVLSIATNFNGATNLVRADSIYVLDEGLRLKGTSAAPTGAPGMDMNYDHAFQAGNPGTAPFGGPAPNSNNRVVFAARPDGNIDVFDTFFYGVVGSVPVRDPIIGPLRVGKDALGNQLLFGITARGLVMVRLPTIINPNPAPPPPRGP